MAQEQSDAMQFFAQIEGMSGAQLAERGRIGQMRQRWADTPWSRRNHSLESLAFAAAEIFGLLHGKDERVEAVRDAAQDMMRNADAVEPLTADRKRGFMDAAITQLAEADIAPTAYFTDEPAPDAEDDAPADKSARWTEGLSLGDHARHGRSVRRAPAGYNSSDPHRIKWNGKLMFSRPPVAEVFTGACEWQRGLWVAADANHPEIDQAMPFTGEEIYAHITLQETAAAADGIVETVLQRDYSNCTIKSRIDATAAVKYIRCLGGRKAASTQRIAQLQELLRERHIQIVASHVAGEQNPADAPSRRRMGLPEYKLNVNAFAAMQAQWGPIGLDACAEGGGHEGAAGQVSGVSWWSSYRLI